MRGLNVKHLHLAKLLTLARNKAGYTQAEAASLTGMSSINYLSRCEIGTDGFPLAKIKRLTEIYGIKPKEVSEAIIEDYRIALVQFWNDKEKS